MTSRLLFTCNSSECMLGDGSSAAANGVSNPEKTIFIIIPKYFKSKPVISIGEKACMRCLNLKHVLIKADIKYIHADAFAYCRSIETINIPKTVEFIGKYALTCYNEDNSSINTSYPNSLGTFTVSFEPGSMLKQVVNKIFSRKEFYIVKVPEPFKFLECNTDLYFGVTKFTVYSKEEFKFCKTQTTVVPNINYYSEYAIMNDIINSFKHVTCKYKKQESMICIFFACLMLKLISI